MTVGMMSSGPRDYGDIKSGTWAAEAAEYAKAGEVKSVSKDGHQIATFGGGCFWGRRPTPHEQAGDKICQTVPRP